MSTTATRTTTAAFALGMNEGKQRVFCSGLTIPGGEFCFLPSEAGVIEVIENLIYSALEGSLTEEQLHQDVGRVIGYAITHPQAF